MTKVRTAQDISPDGYSRFYVLADVLRQAYGAQRKKISILDVGGASEFLDQELSRVGLSYELTVLDILKRPPGLKVNYVQGDATAMAFSDNSYDAVVSTDTLEHIPLEKKEAFERECIRVAKDMCIIAAPFDTEGVEAAEKVVNDFNKSLFGSGQNWLEEHFLYGKPSASQFATLLKKEGIQYEDFGTQNITTWLLNTHINLIEARLGLSAKDHAKINRYYNDHILQMNEFHGPTYRHFFVIYKNSATQKSVDIQKYTTSVADAEKFAGYMTGLMGLLATRITELMEANAGVENKLKAGDRVVSRLRKELELSRKLAAERGEIIAKNEKLIKFADKINGLRPSNSMKRGK